MIVLGLLDRRFEPLRQIGPEAASIADQPKPDPFAVNLGQLALEVEAHQAGKVGDLFVAAPPILGRKSIDGDDLDAMPRPRP